MLFVPRVEQSHDRCVGKYPKVIEDMKRNQGGGFCFRVCAEWNLTVVRWVVYFRILLRGGLWMCVNEG